MQLVYCILVDSGGLFWTFLVGEPLEIKGGEGFESHLGHRIVGVFSPNVDGDGSFVDG